MANLDWVECPSCTPTGPREACWLCSKFSDRRVVPAGMATEYSLVWHRPFNAERDHHSRFKWMEGLMDRWINYSE